MPSSTSFAVLRYPKPDPIGCCGVVMASAYEAEAMGDRRRLGAAADVELGENAGDVHARGLLGHEQLRADLAVRRAAGQQLEHLALARRQAEGVLARARRCRRLIDG